MYKTTYKGILYSTGNVVKINDNFKWSINYKNIKSLCCAYKTNITIHLYPS